MSNAIARSISRRAWCVTAMLATLLLTDSGIAAAQNLGMMGNGRDRVIIFDADTGAVLNDFPLGPQDNTSGFGDCAITPDGTLGFLSDSGAGGVFAVDLTTSPPGAVTELIELPGAIPTDLTITHDGRFLVTGSNFNLFAPVTVIDIATRSEASRIGLTQTQSVSACDDGSIVGSNSRGLAQRFELGPDGTISRVAQSTIPPFFINSVCAPGSETAILVNNNTAFGAGNGQIRTHAQESMATIDTLGTGRESNGSPLLDRTGQKFFLRRNQRALGFNYDSANGVIDPMPFFEVTGLVTVNSFGSGESMALHPDGSRLYIPISNRIDVYSTTDSSFVGSVTDPSIIGIGPLCASPEPAAPILLVADPGGPYVVNEGASIMLDASNSIGNIALFEWDFDFDGTFTVDATGNTPTFDAAVLDGPEMRTVALRVSDAIGNRDTAVSDIEILNVAPIADAGGPYVVDEGGTVALEGTAMDALADQDSLVFEWDLDGDGVFDDALGPSPVLDAAELDGPGLVVVNLRVSDGDGGSSGGSGSGDPASAEVQVNNVAPTIGDISGLPADPEAITQILSVSADYFDPGVHDAQSATWYWGDGTSSSGTVMPNGDGSGSITGKHVYAEPGVYVVSILLDDGDGGLTNMADDDLLVVYDPDGGFITGGGRIDSPPGAYLPDPAVIGSANFGFVAKYKKAATVPVGSTEFQFQAGSVNFHANDIHWLVVSGARAQFEGNGSVNGVDGYGFKLTATDAALSASTAVDTFRIKIWQLETNVLLYDNQIGSDDDANPVTALTGGSIAFHKVRSKD